MEDFINWELFCSSQLYYDQIKKLDKPYCDKYYEFINKCPNSNEIMERLVVKFAQGFV